MEELTFWDHLEVLRRSIFRILAVLAVLSVGYFIAMPRIFDPIIMGPCFGDFPGYRLLSNLFAGSGLNDPSFHLNIINIRLTSQFMVHMSASFLLAFLTGFPYLFYEIWRFIAPALFDRERHNLRLAFALASLLFFAGLALGYFLIFPITLRFLAGYQITSLVNNQLSLDSYFSTFVSMNLIMGLIFELPILAMLLSKLGLIKRSFFRKYRRHAIVVLVIIAAVITPTGDPFTLTIVSLPLILLYELSALLVKKGSHRV